MNTTTIGSTASGKARERIVSSGQRLLMYGIEKWPANLDDQWQRKMNEARRIAVHHGLAPELVQLAASMGIARLVRTADNFRKDIFEKVRAFMKEHEFSISEVTDEMFHRIATVRLAYDLTEEHVRRMTGSSLTRYVDDGGSPEFAIKLADVMGIAEDQRSFLRLKLDSYVDVCL